MNEWVSFRRDGDVGMICIDSPPVNALGHPVRSGLVAALAQAEADADVAALVVYGAGRMFSAGADVREFGKPMVEPGLRAVIAAYERCAKPIVAVLHGKIAGGGLEFALGCHYRVALPGSEVALPEVKLGLIPGAGGTQRLPRLAGVCAAMEIIASGRFVAASEAESLGIVDAISDTEPPVAGMQFARELIAKRRVPRLVRDQHTLIDAARADAKSIKSLRDKLAAKARGQLSVTACLDAIQAAVDLPFEDGLKREREIFDACMQTDQRKALIHAFFGERAVAKVPGIDANIQPRPIAKVAVVGAGTMGGGITMSFVNAGVPVTLIETSDEALQRGVQRMRANYEVSVKRGRFSEEQVESRMNLVQPTIRLADAGDADLVIEAVFEDMTVKKAVFKDLHQLTRDDAILATNTSYLNVDAIAAVTASPQNVLGMHFFSPANVMRLLEVVRGKETAPDVLVSALAIGKRIGKVSVVAGVCDGFIGNRMWGAYQRQINYMLEDGALPQDVDAAMKAFGFPMGPFAVSDLAGLDIGYANRRREDATRDPNQRYVDIGDKLVEAGRLGQKSGAGWYRYESNQRQPIVEPEVDALVRAASERKGIARRSISDDEIRTRVLTALANEGAFILEEGIAARPVDIDMVWLHGYGFPRFHGGPMFWADSVGAKTVRDNVEKFAADDAYSWQVAPLLARLAAQGQTFAEWSEQN